APRWQLVDSEGQRFRSPPEGRLQLIVFSDHSLKSYPSVVEGLRELKDEAVDLEIVILLRTSNDMAEPMVKLLGLGDIPLVTGSPSLYGRYNVRVTPFVIFVDPSGRARASS